MITTKQELELKVEINGLPKFELMTNEEKKNILLSVEKEIGLSNNKANINCSNPDEHDFR